MTVIRFDKHTHSLESQMCVCVRVCAHVRLCVCPFEVLSVSLLCQPARMQLTCSLM